MNYTSLSIDQAPPIATPLRFFLSAPLFGILAVLALLFYGPEVLQERWLPQTIAITHLFTLGFITMTMMGALFQLLPVLAGAAVYRASLSASLVHILVTSGVALFALGMYLQHGLLLRLSLLALLPGLLLFLLIISFSLLRARSSHASITGMRIAIVSLWITVALGSLLAFGHAFTDIPLARQFTTIHIAWASVGWLSIMIVSISYQVIPMFQVTSEYPAVIKRYFAPLVFATLLIWTLVNFAGYGSDWLDLAVLMLVCMMFVLFISITLHLLIQRKKRLADASLYFWLFGLMMLPLSLLAVFYAAVTQAPLQLFAAVIFIAGFTLSVVNAMMYKILPFLVWLHLHQRRAFSARGIGDIPTMNEIIPMKQAYRQFYLHACAVLCLALAIFFPGLFFYPALLLLLVNWLALEWHLLHAFRLYLRHRQ